LSFGWLTPERFAAPRPVARQQPVAL